MKGRKYEGAAPFAARVTTDSPDIMAVASRIPVRHPAQASIGQEECGEFFDGVASGGPCGFKVERRARCNRPLGHGFESGADASLHVSFDESGHVVVLEAAPDGRGR